MTIFELAIHWLAIKHFTAHLLTVRPFSIDRFAIQLFVANLFMVAIVAPHKVFYTGGGWENPHERPSKAASRPFVFNVILCWPPGQAELAKASFVG